MLKVIANQYVDLSQEEFNYYQELQKVFGNEDFQGLFKSDEQGQIIAVMPSNKQPTAMILIFFFLNIMLNQKLRKIDSWVDLVDTLKLKIENLEEKIEKIQMDVNQNGKI